MPHDGVETLFVAGDLDAAAKLLARISLARNGVAVGYAGEGAADLQLIDGLLEIPYTILNGDRDQRLPGNANVSFEFVEGESLLLWLDMMGISASTGSACSSNSLEPSHVLLSIGLPVEKAHGSIRFSLSHANTEEEVDKVIENMKKIVEKLRLMSPIYPPQN